MVTAKTGTVQKFPKPRGRAPKNASGQPATWDPDRGEWTGVVKDEARRRAEAARPRAPRRDLGLRQGRVGRRHEAVEAQAENSQIAEARGREEARRQAREERERQVSKPRARRVLA